VGIQASYRRLSQEEFERLIQDPEYADAYFGFNIHDEDMEAREAYRQQLEESGRYLDIGKDWDAIHFLVTGLAASHEANQVEPPLGNLIMGGNPTWWDAAYGVVRYLASEEVQELSEALDSISPADMESRLNVRSFCDAQLYPLNQNWSRHAIDLVPPVYDALRAFIREAAKRGEILLLALN
jgi:hypothetical protein